MKCSVNSSSVIPVPFLPYVISPTTFKYLEILIPSPKPSPGHPVRFLTHRGHARHGHMHVLVTLRGALCRATALRDLQLAWLVPGCIPSFQNTARPRKDIWRGICASVRPLRETYRRARLFQ